MLLINFIFYTFLFELVYFYTFKFITNLVIKVSLAFCLMMYKLFFIFLFIGCCSFSQNVNTVLIDSTAIKLERAVGKDTFGTLYYTTDDYTFYKKSKDTTTTYTNFQLGNITSANAFNPLKINLFYEDFNTVIILDNRLAEISKIDFNLVEPYKNITFVSTGFSNTLWLFNQDKQILELYDYTSNSVKVKTVPIASRVLDLKSDYNYCYLLTEDYLYVYNYFGSLINKYPNAGYEALAFSKAHLILKKEDLFYILPKNTTKISVLKHTKLLINQFFATNESLYIYNGELLYQYKLKLE